ncbi:MAG: aromatic amino acid lyase, partial [Marinomonas sp.]
MNTLTPGTVTLADLADIFWNETSIRLDPACRPALQQAHDRIAAAAAGSDAVYGVNTGFGKLASVKIAAEDTAILQRNLILSHCCGVGPAIPRRHARLMMALKLLSLGR